MNLTNSSTTSAAVNCRVTEGDYFLENAVATLLSITLNLVTSPLIILMNVLVITSIKTRRRLQTMYNILLANLAGTDLLVGLVSQPIFISQEIFLLSGSSLNEYCTLYSNTIWIINVPCIASLLKLALLSAERYLAMKYSLRYQSIVTTPRLTIAVICSWAISVIPLILRLNITTVSFSKVLFFASVISSIVIIVYCHTVVYFISRRHMIQIKAEQMTNTAKVNFLEERKALKTTTIIVGFVFMSYLPGVFYAGLKYILPLFNRERQTIWLPFATTCILVNSFFNPIIYSWRNKGLRKAMSELLSFQRGCRTS